MKSGGGNQPVSHLAGAIQDTRRPSPSHRDKERLSARKRLSTSFSVARILFHWIVMKSGISRILLTAVLLCAGLAVSSPPSRGAVKDINPHLREGCIHCHTSGEGTLIISSDEEGPHSVLAHSCLTCHKEGKGRFWIVVLPAGEGVPAVHRPAKSSPRAALAEQVEGFPNSHDSLECTKCHRRNPGSVGGQLPEPFPFGSAGVSAYCLGCHQAVKGTHYPRNNRPRKSVTCLSCHQAHGSSLLFPALREDVGTILLESKDLNPHGGKIFCLACHRDDPVASGAVTFRSEGDADGMCRRCHAEEEHHPLGVAAGSKTWKMDFSDLPLEEDRITCVTCHDPYECEGTVTKDNPRFLRGGPYSAVEDFCVRCHEGRTVANLNPHDQVDDSGDLRPKQCLLCHTTEPEEGFELTAADFTDSLSSLCASCHPIGPHPSADHLMRIPEAMLQTLRAYEEERLVVLPLEEETMITCVTCHNPHERGVLTGPAGIGADEEHRLRLATFNEICTPCHGRR